MSWKVYINGQQLEMPPTFNVAQTKQANDLANLTTRNSNFTQNIKIPKTARNRAVLEFTEVTGSGTNVPYKRNLCDVIDSDTGKHLIYLGWAVVTGADENFYNVAVYDGSIDFYRAIENLNLTDVGISDLNHIKSLANIVATWTNESTPYRYILADYNGDNLIDGFKVNIDYQVPSASVRYLWERIFSFIGMEYNGAVFTHEKFVDLWLTFPKPTGETVPNEILINTQTLQEIPYIRTVFVGNAQFQETVYWPGMIQENFAELDANATNANNTTPNIGFVNVTAGGFFSVRVNNPQGNTFELIVYDALNQIVQTLQFTDVVFFNAEAGQKFHVKAVTNNPSPFGGDFQATPFGFDEMTLDINRVDGFAVNFEEIFIDFKVSDFVREIVIRFGLTPFIERGSKTVEFLTLREIFQNPIQNLSKKFTKVISQSYRIGSYAKRNTFKYKYNDEGFDHNNGFLSIDNDNLPEEFVIFQSQIYSPESEKSFFLFGSNVYKIWEKEINDDSEVEYKDLEGRFYFQRSQRINLNVTLASAITSTELTATPYYRESYHRLRWFEILQDWYEPINLIFNKARNVTAEFYLNAIEVAELELKRLIYIEQLGSYYLINKVNNFIKGRPTRLDLIEVDYFTEPEIPLPQQPTIQIDAISLEDCEITLEVTTDLVQPTQVQIIPYTFFEPVPGGGFFTEYFVEPPIFATLENDEVIFSIDQLPTNTYKFQIRKLVDYFGVAQSGLSDEIVLDGSCNTTPQLPTEITITNAQDLGAVSIFPFTYRRIVINYTFDELPSGTLFYQVNVAFKDQFQTVYQSGGIYTKSISEPTVLDVNIGNQASVIEKVQIFINGVLSNEFEL